MGLAPGVADVYLLDQIGKLRHLLVEEGVYFFHRLVAAVESFAQDLRVAEVATAVLVYLHMEAARRQVIVEGAIAEVDAHYQRVVLLGYWILAASCLGADRGGCSTKPDATHRDTVIV